MVTDRHMLLGQLEEAVQDIIQAVQEIESPEGLQVDDWSAKDTLGHIAFWHESFARNVRALVEGTEPDVLKGSYSDLNRAGVELSAAMSVGQIIGRIRQAQDVIRRNILILPADQRIPYRKGSRDYTPDEHLEIVRDHILAHLKQLEKAKRRRR